MVARLKLSALLTALVIALLAAVAPAQALTVRPASETAFSFEGATCGSTALALVQLPRGVRDARIVQPLLGEDIASDEEPSALVATITTTGISSSGGRLVAGWQATGSNDVCNNSANYPDGWATDEIDLIVRFTQNVKTYVGSVARRRPATLNLGLAGRLTGLGWSSWNGPVARGRGVGPGGAPVRVRLSQPTDCGRYKYLFARYTYTGAVPRGRSRSRGVSLSSTC